MTAAPKPDSLHPHTDPRAGTGQEPTVIEAAGRSGDTSAGRDRYVLLDVMSDGQQAYIPLCEFREQSDETTAADICRELTGGSDDITDIANDFDLLGSLRLYVQVRMPDGAFTRASLRFEGSDPVIEEES